MNNKNHEQRGGQVVKIERLADMKPLVEDRLKFLQELTLGFEKGQIFLTALELDVFTQLKEPKTAEALSADMGTHRTITQRFLDVLVAIGVLAKAGDQYLTAPDVVPFLAEDESCFARCLNHSIKRRGDWMRLKRILKEGQLDHAHEHEHNAHEHEHKYDRKGIDSIARGAMTGRLQATLKIVSKLPEFKNAKKLIDLGGGHGLFGIGFAQENPQLEVIIFDQPGVTDITQGYINEYGMQDRVRTMTGDYTKDDIGSDYDIAFCACSHGGCSEEPVSFYHKVCDALNDNGLYITQTFTMDDDRTGPLSVLIWALMDQMTMTGGRGHACTNAELFKAFEKSGLGGEQVIDMSEWASMPMRTVIARKR